MAMYEFVVPAISLAAQQVGSYLTGSVHGAGAFGGQPVTLSSPLEEQPERAWEPVTQFP